MSTRANHGQAGATKSYAGILVGHTLAKQFACPSRACSRAIKTGAAGAEVQQREHGGASHGLTGAEIAMLTGACCAGPGNCVLPRWAPPNCTN